MEASGSSRSASASLLLEHMFAIPVLALMYMATVETWHDELKMGPVDFCCLCFVFVTD